MNQPEPIDYLFVDDLLEIAAGVLGEAPVRDIGLLASAAARPSAAVFGDDAYPAFAGKAAILLHSLARNPASGPTREGRTIPLPSLAAVVGRHDPREGDVGECPGGGRADRAV